MLETANNPLRDRYGQTIVSEVRQRAAFGASRVALELTGSDLIHAATNTKGWAVDCRASLMDAEISL